MLRKLPQAGPGHGTRLRGFGTVASFMTPAWLGLLIFFGYPLVATIWFSLNKFDLFSAPRWFGLGNFAYMLEDQNLHRAAANTLWLVVVNVPVKVGAALVVALLLAKLRRSASIWRTIFYLPALIPPVAATVAFVFLFNPGTGVVNTVLGWAGIEGPLWFNDPDLAKPSLVLLCVWGLGDGYASALALVLFLFSLLFTVLLLRRFRSYVADGSVQ